MKTFHTEIEDAAQALDERSKALRKKIVMVMDKAGRGHLASALSLVEIVRVLYDDILKYDSNNPQWPMRDRFILSKGHGCLALYVILAEKGFFPESELWRFCKKDGLLGGHPEKKIPGVEASTGSLGHGFSVGLGFALNAIYEKAEYRTIVVLGDGECNEGSVWEAALSAGKHKLNNLTIIVDYNKYQSYGSTQEVQDLEPFLDKWKSFGFAVADVDGHDIKELRTILYSLPLDSDKPNAVICHTVKGKGISFVENNLSWHHKSKLSESEIQKLLASVEAY